MNILNHIGNTPLIEIQNIWQSDKVRIFAKVEGMNPSGSIKDRVALYMIQKAIHRQTLKRDMEIVEATSGNTGISFAMVCSVYGYNCTLVMPKKVSMERIKKCRAYGANIVTVDGNIDTAIDFVEIMKRDTKSKEIYYNPNQYDNIDNIDAHYYSTGYEISNQLYKKYKIIHPSHFVSSMGTTGTIMGCSKWFKKRDGYLSSAKIIGVSPQEHSKIHGLKNLKFARVPKIYYPDLIDETITIKDIDAIKMTKRLAQKEGLFCGVSSGAAVHVAIEIAKELDKNANIVVILPDSGDKYLSERLF